MKLLLLSNPNSAHTIKWAKSLANNNIKIIVFGLGNLTINDYHNNENIKVETLNQHITKDEGSFLKLNYLQALPLVKRIIQEFKPDIVHAHYATSYGLLGSLSNFSPFILSVWGSDVFSFPRKSFLHKTILKYNFKKADKILSTSNIMRREIKLYTNKKVEITPFGIDIEQFKPMDIDSLFDKNDIVIGTIKTLENNYGIEYLIKAFKIVFDKYYYLPLKLLIVGSGSLEMELKQLVKQLSLEKKTIFTGNIAYSDIPKYHNMLTVSVSVSNSESFGVAIIEASSCAKPVIVSNVGGLPEVVQDGISGFIVPPQNPQETANAIEKLILDKSLRNNLGKNGRELVKRMYNWNDNVKQMINIYKEITQ